MLGYAKEQKNLRKEQKEAIGLLSVGTFLEYFDLMLYVHMAVLLNELFFPKQNQSAAYLLSAFAFCSTFAFRSIGALVFGWIGDKIGRKTTVVMTSFLMALSCFLMFILPTYAEIGFTAAVIVTICRALQGMSSLGEIIGAELYLTELTKPPIQYPVVASCDIFGNLGAAAALGVATLVTMQGFNWRYAFLFGTIIAVIGAIARTRLRETVEFVDATKRLVNKIENFGLNKSDIETNINLNDKLNIKTLLAYFTIESTGPICFYFKYILCGDILKTHFAYTSSQVITHNFIVSIITLINSGIVTYLSYKFHPLKILRIRWVIFACMVLFYPYLLIKMDNVFQVLIGMFAIRVFPAAPIFYKNFPVFKRFRCVSLTFAIVRAIMFVLTSFGLVYLVKIFNYWGILILLMPFTIFYKIGLNYFEKLEFKKDTNLVIN